MPIVLFDNSNRDHLYPLTINHAVGELRCGILSFKERWENISGENVYIHTRDHLAGLYEAVPREALLWIDAAVLPGEELVQQIMELEPGNALMDGEGMVAVRLNIPHALFTGDGNATDYGKVIPVSGVTRLQYPWQIFQWNAQWIERDLSLVAEKKTAQPLPGNNSYLNEANIFIETGASVNFSIINASEGPVYIGRDALVMEGCMIRGPVAICNNAVVKMGAKVYGGTTIGPYCVAGGEIKNSSIQAFSNKAHDGYLGDAVIGQWCNLGAGTSNSNVKNTGGAVRIYHGPSGSLLPAGNKCGVIMGDYSRTAINTSINTGTVTGLCCNVFGQGSTPKYMPDFSWGMSTGTYYDIGKAIEHIANWKKMKGQLLEDAEISVLKYIFERSRDTGRAPIV